MESAPAMSAVAVADLRNCQDRCAPDACVLVLERRRQCLKRPRIGDLAERPHDLSSNVRVGVVDRGDERLDRCAVAQLTESCGRAR